VTELGEKDLGEATVFTDRSVDLCGGAAAITLLPGHSVKATFDNPRNRTHAELVALSLAGKVLDMVPVHGRSSTVATDSLAALQLVRCWGRYPSARRLKCIDREDVRRAIAVLNEAGCSGP